MTIKGSADKAHGKHLVGTSGWKYKSWKGTFYPPTVPPSTYLEYYCRYFPTVEINNSFYKLPSEATYLNWKQQAGADFIFAVKASRYLTHMKKLKDPDDPWERLTSRALNLGNHLGPILLQFPARWPCKLYRLEEFLTVVASCPEHYRLAFEFRDDSWFEKPVFQMLEKYNAAICIADSTQFTRCDRVTADFAYIRYHGRDELYAANYEDAVLEQEAKMIKSHLKNGLDVYAYFNNDARGHAINNARTLTALLEV